MGYIRLQFELSRQESTIVYTAFKYFQKVITNHNKHPSELIAEKIIYDYSLLKNCMSFFNEFSTRCVFLFFMCTPIDGL